MDDEKIRELYIKEIKLDRYHGFVGKTVIHPKQIEIVQALSTISYEDYIDAKDIIENYLVSPQMPLIKLHLPLGY